jgi:hypothetical protein
MNDPNLKQKQKKINLPLEGLNHNKNLDQRPAPTKIHYAVFQGNTSMKPIEFQ